jgi:hypothetical protein
MNAYANKRSRRRSSWLVLVLLSLGGTLAQADDRLPTPLEQAKFQRISTSAEISAYLDSIAAAVPFAKKEVVGQSVQGRPIETLVFRDHAGSDGPGRMTIMVTGSQHGAAEPAGGEALMVIARELASGELKPLLQDADIILLPNANPDGRDLTRRANANWININTDFVLAMQAETRVMKEVLARYAPEALLDSHESAILKRKTLAKDGYLTDFEAQFEIANNAGITAALRRFTLEDLLPELDARVTAAGLPAHRYIGEITSIRQPITHGGLTLRNFRNTAGMSGAAAFLVETKLDSREDSFPTYRNIAVRLEKQLICIRSFLRLMHERRDAIMAEVARAREAAPRENIQLYAGYVLDKAHPTVKIPMRRLDTRELEDIEFRDHRKVETADEIAMPSTLLIVEHQAALARLLDKHRIVYEALEQPMKVEVQASRFEAQANITERVAVLATEAREITAPAGTLAIDTAQANGRAAVLLLDPRSTSSVFRYPEYATLVTKERDHFVYPVFKGVARAP